MEHHNKVGITYYKLGNTTWFNISSRNSRFDFHDLASKKCKETESEQKLIDNVFHYEIHR